MEQTSDRLGKMETVRKKRTNTLLGLIFLIGVAANKEVIKHTILHFKTLHWQIKYALPGKSKAFKAFWNLSQTFKCCHSNVCASAAQV